MAIYPSNQAEPVSFDAPIDPRAQIGQGLVYFFDFSDWLGTDTIATFSLTYPDGGLVEILKSLNPEQTRVSVNLRADAASGRAGREARVVCEIVTAAGLNDIRTGIVPLQEK